MRKYFLGGLCAAVLTAVSSGGAWAQGAPIKIGVVLPYAPPFEIYSKSMEIAMRMAVEELGGSVAGRKIELIFEDDGNKPPQAITKAKKLISSDKVDILVGGLASNLAIPIHQEAVGAQQPTVMINAGAGNITGKDCSPWVMRVSFSNDQIIRDSGAWLFKKGFKSAYGMAADYAGGREIIEIFKREFEKAGGKFVGDAYPPFATKDFGPYLAQAKAAKPDIIYTFFPGGMGIQFVVEYDKFGLKGQIQLSGPAWTVGPLFIEKQGKSAVGFIGPINYVPTLDNPANKKFVENFRKKSNGRDPDEVTINGYDAIQMIALGLKAVNGKTDDKKAMMAAIRNASYDGPRGPMKIDPKTNNVIQNIYMIEIKEVNGKPTHVVVDTIKNVQDPPNGCTL
ncbi:MAG: ABC transporter substrate-binding protein [Alphaproteobacteria bacterium]